MALLHYENLGVHRPDKLLDRTFYGLRDFYQFLKLTLDHLNSEETVLRLGCSPAPPPDDFEWDGVGAWVELREPDDRPNEPERTFDAFLDDDVSEVFELDRRKATADGPAKRVSFARERRLQVLDRDPRTNRLLLDRAPTYRDIVLRPNTTTLRRQLQAVKELQDAPAPHHLPLLRLFEEVGHVSWPRPAEPDLSAISWSVLGNASRPGTDEQRRFVAMALQTPDFAFLEGPPGSGKTTAICELVLQLIGQGKRVLLCASTHVAVDNVLERLRPLALRDDSDLIPVRIGDRRKVSEGARVFQLEEAKDTWRRAMLDFLRARAPRTEAQEDLYRTLSRAPTAVERIILDSANVVCGTTAGIPSHPDIRDQQASKRAGMFDVLILDEASKTTFQEFLIPALLAQRWVIVGDPRQLSPFVDEVAIAANLRAAVPDESARNASVDVFLVGGGDPRRRRGAVVASGSEHVAAAYARQAAAHGVLIARPESAEAPLADLIIGPDGEVAACADRLPLHAGTVRCAVNGSVARRAAAVRQRAGVRDDDPPAWENELGWRLCRHYEQRQAKDSVSARRHWADIESLLPVEAGGVTHNGAFDRIDRVRRVAFPSVLESLQQGFSPGERRIGTALSDGLPKDAFAVRHVLLEWQHRMHPEISRVPRERVYGGAALKDPPGIEDRLPFQIAGYQRHAIWLHVAGRFDKRHNRNDDEVAAVVNELQRLWRWARGCPNPLNQDGSWEVAVLTFYRGQEQALRDGLRRLANASRAYRYFNLSSSGGRVDLHLELCTVDRFQGHEADIVFLSLANTRATDFLESVNRVNVAVTRPRHQRVIFGNRNRLGKGPESLLQYLAINEHWEHAFGGDR